MKQTSLKVEGKITIKVATTYCLSMIKLKYDCYNGYIMEKDLQKYFRHLGVTELNKSFNSVQELRSFMEHLDSILPVQTS